MNAQSIAVPLADTKKPGLPLSVAAGFFMSFRVFITLLSVRFFGADGRAGTAFGLLLNYVLFLAVVFATFGPTPISLRPVLKSRSFRWVLAFLCFSLCSLGWTAAASKPAAVAFWLAMAADTGIAVLLLSSGDARHTLASFFRGYIAGAIVVSIIAWLMPAQSDLRLGDEELLGPNQIGYVCAFAALLAQYLMSTGHRYAKSAAAFLSITLLRSLSKTTIVAFLAAQAFLLLRDTTLSRRTKLSIVGAATVVLVAFSSMLSAYFAVYTANTDSAESLTGRLGIWTYFLIEGAQQPWIGHGFHSVWNVVPLFGVFEARHAHNELIQQFYAYGITGLVLLCGLYGSFFRQMKRFNPGPLRSLSIAFLIFALVRGFADTEAFDLSLPIWLISMIGIAALRITPSLEVAA